MRPGKKLLCLSLFLLFLNGCGSGSENSSQANSVDFIDLSATEITEAVTVPATRPRPSEQTETSTEDRTDFTIADETEDLTEPTETTEEMTEPTEPLNYRGSIYDCRGTVITYTEFPDPEEGGDPKRVFNADYSTCFSNIISDDSKGLDKIYESILREDNNEDCDTGRSVQLTFNADVQDAIYQYMAEQNFKGSVVVMRTDGSIMAEVSYPSYDANRYRYELGYPSTLSNSDAALMNKAEQTASPGSCFKMMSEVLADMHGIHSLDDEGEWMGIHNWDWDTADYPKENRPLADAFRKSSNVYFAKTFEEIGEKTVLEELSEYFCFRNDELIECDFGGMRNAIYMNDAGDLRRTGFGQANVRTSPVFLAALTREAIFGQMVRPFTLKAQVNTNDFTDVIETGSTAYDVLAEYPEEYMEHLHTGMAGVAEDFGVTVPEGYSLYCKTGTAEVGSGDYLYVSGCLLNDKDNTAEHPVYTDYTDYAEQGSYIIITQLQNPSYFGYDFASETGILYRRIMNLVIDND